MEKSKKVSSDESSLGRIVADVPKKKKILFSTLCKFMEKNENKVIEEFVDDFIQKNKGVLKDA